ncbi:MAG: elongation factor P [Acidimicrobiaceae bacterium]|jgi:elongation factor P|nr:elongation factor P [Acidimicrobiaceae bacterium]|tara:strand:+ start:119690 stop:120253 length:564 start_codon:yes stop_codon:yes gene_type:complete
MASISTNDFKNGWTVMVDGNLMQIVEFQHVKPGKGPAFVRTKIKNVRTGSVIEKTFRAGESLERVNIDKREMQYLYRDGSDLVFMDNETYEQINVSPEAVGELPNYLIESKTAVLLMFGSEIVGTEISASVELVIAETEPGIQGDRVSGATKPAVLETGLTVQVPLFLETGEKIKVDTRTGSYMSRA